MMQPNRPLSSIAPELPKADRRPTLIRPHTSGGLFSGWGPKL
jgi:hypothetical protein